MKRLAFALTLLIAASTGFAQETGSAMKSTVTLHDDGSRTETVKDLENRVSESRKFDAAKRLVQRSTFTLDEKGRELDGIFYDAKGTIIGRITYAYDALGRMSEQVEKTADGRVTRKLVYRHDFTGRVVGIDAYDAQGNLLKPAGAKGSKKSRAR